MKFLHIADLHLDRDFEGLVQKTLWKPYEILTDIVDFACSEKVDFVILAGDNFHKTKPSIKMQSYFIDQLNRLDELDIPVFMIFGNHDYYQDNIYWFEFPSNVKIFYSQDVASKYFTLANGEKVAISAFSYESPHILENKIIDYPDRYSDVDYHLGIFHGEIGGDKYAPASLLEMKNKNYDYWALGHIHLTNQLADNIIYPGTPLGRTRKEVTSNIGLVTLTKTDLHVDLVDLAKTHFENLEVDLKEVSSLALAMEKIQSSFVNKSSFYSVNLKNYESLKEEILAALKSDELIDSLRAQGFIVVKIKLDQLDSKNDRIKLPSKLEHDYELTNLLEKLPKDAEVNNILTEDFKFELAEVVDKFIMDTFEEGNEDNENKKTRD